MDNNFEIFILQDNGQRYPIKVTSENTVSWLKALIYHRQGVEPARQRLVYFGKELVDNKTLSEYQIKPNDFVHYFIRGTVGGKSVASPFIPPPEILSTSPMVSIAGSGKDVKKEKSPATKPISAKVSRRLATLPPSIEHPFLSMEETLSRIGYWNKRAEKGKFDPDIHIVDPLAHYSHLDYLEHAIVLNSEFFRCKGRYNLDDPEYYDDIHIDGQVSAIVDDMWHTLSERLVSSIATSDSDRGTPGGFPSSSSTSNAPIVASGPAIEQLVPQALSLKKTLMLLHNVQASIKILDNARFCTTFFSMLVERGEGDIAELIKIPQKLLTQLSSGIELAIVEICRPNKSFDETKDILRRQIYVPCKEILERAHLVVDDSPATVSETLRICRTVVLLLDLVIVAYAGSHASRIDTFIESSSGLINIPTPHKNSIICSRRPLACLDEFLQTSVWVFHWGPSQLENADRGDENTKLSILCRMDVFADVWGPVWTAMGTGKFSDRVQQYNLSRGCIRANPITQPVSSPVKNTVSCHWFDSPKRASNSQSGTLLRRDDLLLIGASLRKNDQCLYKLRHYEADYGTSMGFLGTVPGTWRWDTRAVGLTAGQFATLNVQGTQKRYPGRTRKEHIWTKWNLSPETANIEWLNNFLGLEVSHCTGNARRVRTRDLLGVKAVRDRLNRISPNWETTEWGTLFSTALQSDSSETISNLWDNNEGIRKELGKFLCKLLELLHETGTDDDGNHLIAAYFKKHADDRQMELNIQGNEWARCLRDSRNMATYAVIGDVCLKCASRRDEMRNCIQEQRTETTYQTRIVFKGRLPPNTEYIRLLPFGEVFRVNSLDDGQITLSAMTGRRAMELFRQVFRSGTEIAERIGEYGPRHKEYRALIKAASSSYGGMRSRRQQVDPRIDEEQEREGIRRPEIRQGRQRDPPRQTRGSRGHQSKKSSSTCCTVL